MSKKHTIIAARHNPSYGSLKSYTVGFILSIVLTLAPFYIVINELISGWALVFSLFGFAIAQLLVQLQFFIHLGSSESKPRWNAIMFLGMMLILLIVVAGTLWIMNNLNYHMMPGHEVEKQLLEEEGIHHH